MDIRRIKFRNASGLFIVAVLCLSQAILSLNSWAADENCAAFYQNLERFGLLKVNDQSELAKIWQSLTKEEREKLSQMLERLPSSSPFSRWLHQFHTKLHPWRREDIKDVLKIILQDENQIEALIKRAASDPQSLNLVEKRAAFLLVAEKWWFQEDITALRKISMRKLRPTDFFYRGEIPLESILHSRDQVGFWRGIFQLRASTRDIANILENSSGAWRMEKLIHLRKEELQELLPSATKMEKIHLEYELSRLEILEKLLNKNKEEWSDIIRQQVQNESNPRLKRIYGEQIPAAGRGIEDLAAYGIIFGGLGLVVDKFMPEPKLPAPIPLPAGENVELRPQPAQDDNEMDEAIRDFNSGKITKEELRKKYPQLFR